MSSPFFPKFWLLKCPFFPYIFSNNLSPHTFVPLLPSCWESRGSNQNLFQDFSSWLGSGPSSSSGKTMQNLISSQSFFPCKCWSSKIQFFFGYNCTLKTAAYQWYLFSKQYVHVFKNVKNIGLYLISVFSSQEIKKLKCIGIKLTHNTGAKERSTICTIIEKVLLKRISSLKTENYVLHCRHYV